MDLHRKIEAEIILQNNTPDKDFLGLSPNQFHSLLHDTFGDGSPVQFRNDVKDETLDRIPLFRTAEEFLKIIKREKKIALTPGGALQKKVLVELYDKKFLPEYLIESGIKKTFREDDTVAISTARIIAELAGLVKNENGKITLTADAESLLEHNDRFQIFKLFFEAYTVQFNWSSNDNFPDVPVGQMGWAFSLMMLDKFGDMEKSSSFYAERYSKALPMFTSAMKSGFLTPEDSLYFCYILRTFDRFFHWFGFITFNEKEDSSEKDDVDFYKTNVVQNLFVIEDFPN